MIIGIGTDLCDISRIELTLARFGERFIRRCFTEQEMNRAERRPNKRADRYAQMFAAKEACSKALGTGFRQGVFWRDMEVVHLPSGKPTMRMHGGALKRLHHLTPPGHEPQAEVTLTDEKGLANAVVVLWVQQAHLHHPPPQ